MAAAKSLKKPATLAALAAASALAVASTAQPPGATIDAAAPSKGPKPMTAAVAAMRVQRVTVIEAGGKQHTKTEPISADEVLAFRDYGTHVVVVTIDGHKFSSADAA